MAKTGSAALLLWCQKCTDGYPNVKIENFHISWRSGLGGYIFSTAPNAPGFCAIIHHFYPDALDFKSLSPANILRNNELGAYALFCCYFLWRQTHFEIVGKLFDPTKLAPDNCQLLRRLRSWGYRSS